MTSDIALVDLWASSVRSPWHRASALAKMAFVGAMLFAAIGSTDPRVLAGLVGLAVVCLASARVPLGPALLLALYPLLFSSLFVLSRWDGTWQTPVLLLLRALASSLTAVLLVATKPYPDLFAPIARVTPRLVGDGLFLTYRAFFGLLHRAERMWTALRLRGGLTGRGLPRDFRHAGEGLGQLVLHSYDRSQRLYAVMQIRGHSGRVCGCRHWADFSAADLLPVGLGALVVVLALVLRAAR
jgi:cobalt/nickel transport system permease protein